MDRLTGASPAVAGSPAWGRLRRLAAQEAASLRAPLPPGPGCCVVCRGPARPGYPRCFPCALHLLRAPGLLADVVVPVSYAVSGTPYAGRLWRYKATAGGQQAARAMLRAMLLVFLRDHGRCLWARAGVPAPSHVAVVPSGRGRPGPHPLRALIAPYLRLPWAGLLPHPGRPEPVRELDAGRFRAAGSLAGARVLLIDDTWTSGASAQSAAAALRLGGASTVLTLILGRHLNPGRLPVSSFSPALAGSLFRQDRCAVHDAACPG